jgi:homospermidine synthase
MGMNPGLISSCVKQGLEDAAAFYLRDPKATDLDKKALEKWLGQKNHTKIA